VEREAAHQDHPALRGRKDHRVLRVTLVLLDSLVLPAKMGSKDHRGSRVYQETLAAPDPRDRKAPRVLKVHKDQRDQKDRPEEVAEKPSRWEACSSPLSLRTQGPYLAKAPGAHSVLGASSSGVTQDRSSSTRQRRLAGQRPMR
jgi:hypothetical protein